RRGAADCGEYCQAAGDQPPSVRAVTIAAHMGMNNGDCAMMDWSKRLLKRFLQLPADALIASSTKLPNRILQLAHRSVFLSDGFYPYKPDQQSYIILRPSAQSVERADDSQLPLPPKDLLMGYEPIDHFLSSGKSNVATMNRILESSGF